MAIEETFGNLFKPEIKSSGRKLVTGEKVSINGSDTSVQAYIKVAPPFKVTLSSEAIDSTSFSAKCSCPIAKKSRFCKHIWATLLMTEEQCPDFLIGKQDIEGASAPTDSRSLKQSAYQETAKQKASEYRKAQYQKQKVQAKERKNQTKGAVNSFLTTPHTDEEKTALAYFSQNGFPMDTGPSEEVLNEAKRKLSRIFHPDKGGSHEETVELNQNWEILLNFLRRR